MRVNVAIPEAHVSAPILNSALEATTRVNESLLRAGEIAPFDPSHPGVRWKPEPPGDEHFDHARMVQGRGWGDCDDLAPWRAASLRVTREDPRARAVVRRSGTKRWHAVVRRGDGSIDDPSLDAGMPRRGRGVGVIGAALPLMGIMGGVSGVDGTYLTRPHLALRPVRNRGGQIEAWQARADLPWHTLASQTSPSQIAMASLHASPVSSQAVVGACHGAIWLAETSGVGDDEHLDRLSAVIDACEGADWEELAGEYGEEHADAAAQIVGSFFGKVFRKAKKLATAPVRHAIKTATSVPFAGKLIKRVLPAAVPIAQKVLPFVPGVGPYASLALQAASPMLQQAIARGALQRPEQRQPQGFGYMPSSITSMMSQVPQMYGGYGGVQQWPTFPFG